MAREHLRLFGFVPRDRPLELVEIRVRAETKSKPLPRRRASALRPTEIERLHGSTRKILVRAIENCGTTFSDFQDAHGATGSYQQYLGVYGREDEPCARCGGRIRRIVQQQRSTYYCGGCQR